MAESKEEYQTKPSAPLFLTPRSDQPNEDLYHHDQTKYVHSQSQTKLILCCGIVASLTMLIAVTFIVLSLTVFHLHNPNLTVDSISLVNGKVNNVTVSVEILLHNPNQASFKLQNVTVLYYYRELGVVGESIGRSGSTIAAKRTVKMNLTAEIVTTNLQGLMEDLNGKGVELRSSVVIKGRVKVMKIFKKSVHLQTNCSMMMMMTKKSVTPTFHCTKTHHESTRV